MEKRRKETIRKRASGRLRGLGALFLALLLLLTSVPLLPAARAQAASGDNYYLVVKEYYSDVLLCSGQEDPAESGGVFAKLEYSYPVYKNGYVNYDSSGAVKWRCDESGGLTAISCMGNGYSGSGGTVTSPVTIPESGTAYVGCVTSTGTYSGAIVTVKLDGVEMAETTGLYEDGKASFQLPAGDYSVKAAYGADTGVQATYGIKNKVTLEFTTLAPVAEVVNESGATTQYTTFSDAVGAWDNAGAGSTLKLLADVETTEGITVNKGLNNSMILDLNGYGIRYTGDENSVINVTDAGELKLTDSAPNRVHYITLDENGRSTDVADEGTESDTCVKVTGGYLTGGNKDVSGGGVNVAGTFNMTGGTIIGNTANNGGGVKVNGGTFAMEAGTISDNTAAYNGGVYVQPGSFTMSGGQITNNRTKASSGFGGGGVCVVEFDDNLPTFEMTGGSITGNTTGANGGGVYARGTFNFSGGKISENTANGYGGGIFNYKMFTMSGDSEIVKNTATSKGGGVSNSGGGTFNMNGGKIQENEAEYYAGVRNDGATFTMTDGEISGNTASASIGGVYVYDGAFTMTGGKIVDNIATTSCGGVYVCESNTTFTLSGNPIITDNKSGMDSNSVDSNVYLVTDAQIIVNGALNDTAQIGVNMATPGVFTSSTEPIKASEYKKKFFSDDSTYIVTTEGNELKLLAHKHNFTYSADEATITATCSVAGCTLDDGKGNHTAKLTIVEPTLTTYGQTGEDISAAATLDGLDDFKAATGLDVATTDIKYVGRDGTTYTENTTAPTNAGKYTASITLSSVKTSEGEGKSVSASVDYEIAKKPVVVSGITAGDKTYDGNTTATLVTTAAVFEGKLDSDTLTISATGTFDNANVGNSKTVTITNLTLGGASKDNYVLASTGQQTGTNAKITAKEVGLAWTNTKLTYNGELQTPTATATGLVSGDEGKVNVTVTGGETNAGTEAYTATASGLAGDKADNYTLPAEKTSQYTISPRSITEADVTLDKTELTYTGSEQSVSVTEVSLDGVKLTKDDYDISGNTGTNKEDYTVTVTGKGNYKDTATANWKIVAKAMTVRAEPVSKTYDGNEYGITVNVTDPSNGTTVKYGTQKDTYNLDASPKFKTAGTHTVYFKVSGNSDYNDYEGSATVTILKKPVTATVSAEDKKYDGKTDATVFASVASKDLIEGDSIEITGLKGSFADANAEEGKKVTVDSSAKSISGIGSDNYEVTIPVEATASISKVNPEVEAPVKKALTYTGSAQALVTSGSTTGGTVKYAVTKVNQAPAEDAYTFDDKSLPTAIDAGTYYVWYKVVGDKNHNDSDPKCVKVEILAQISKTVTFKVVNGSWNDGTTADKTVTLTGYEGDTLKLTADQIPAVGTKPGTGYKAGSWDVTPKADAEIKADTTYIYTYAKEEVIQVKTDVDTLAINAGFKVTQSGSKITVKWGKVKDATGYEVYVAYCGKSFSKTPAKRTTTKNSVVVTKIGGKKINLKKNFKVYVKAIKKNGSKNKQLARTITGHIVGRKNTKYTNAKSITLKTKKLSIAVGKTSKIKAKTVLVDKSKKQLSNAHATEFRYASSNKNIATVDKNGKVKGVAKGTCTIYVYARNGYAKTVKVTVK